MSDRTDTARDHDDSDLIDRAEQQKQPAQQGRSGGNIQKDVATQASEERVSDPQGHEGVTKEDDIAHGQRDWPERRPDK